jgi:hypothetical protein
MVVLLGSNIRVAQLIWERNRGRPPRDPGLKNYAPSGHARRRAVKTAAGSYNSTNPFLMANLTSRATEWHWVLSLIRCE